VDLEAGSARIARSFSSGQTLGPTKTGGVRTVELSSRLRETLAAIQPNVIPPPEEALVFPNQAGGFLYDNLFRSRVFSKIVLEALGEGRHYSPHCRHTWASIQSVPATPSLPPAPDLRSCTSTRHARETPSYVSVAARDCKGLH
jgi:hypothetical protein